MKRPSIRFSTILLTNMDKKTDCSLCHVTLWLKFSWKSFHPFSHDVANRHRFHWKHSKKLCIQRVKRNIPQIPECSFRHAWHIRNISWKYVHPFYFNAADQKKQKPNKPTNRDENITFAVLNKKNKVMSMIGLLKLNVEILWHRMVARQCIILSGNIGEISVPIYRLTSDISTELDPMTMLGEGYLIYFWYNECGWSQPPRRAERTGYRSRTSHSPLEAGTPCPCRPWSAAGFPFVCPSWQSCPMVDIFPELVDTWHPS